MYISTTCSHVKFPKLGKFQSNHLVLSRFQISGSDAQWTDVMNNVTVGNNSVISMKRKVTPLDPVSKGCICFKNPYKRIKYPSISVYVAGESIPVDDHRFAFSSIFLEEIEFFP